MDITMMGPACLMAAGILEAAAPKAHKPTMLLIVANCLRAVAKYGPRYYQNMEKDHPYRIEAAGWVILICEALKTPAFDLDGAAFSLAECLAVVTKVNSQGQNTQLLFPMQADVMRFFEDSGHWEPGDGTLVSDMYHNIPA